MLGVYKAYKAKWDFGASEVPFSFFFIDHVHQCSIWKCILSYVPNTPRKTYALNWYRKNYILTWKLTFWKKSILLMRAYKACMAKWAFGAQRCLSVFCLDDTHRCFIWKWMLSYVPNTYRKTYAPNLSRKNFILAGNWFF